MKILILALISIFIAIQGYFELSLIIILFASIYTVTKNKLLIRKKAFSEISVITCISIVGLLFSLGHNPVDILRDFLLIFKNVMFFYVGYVIIDRKISIDSICKPLLIFSFLDIGFYSIKFIIYVLDNGYYIGGVRDVVGHGSVLPIIALFFLYKSSLPSIFKLNVTFFRVAFLTLVIMYIAMTGSRTLFFGLILMYFSFKKMLWIHNPRILLVASSLLIFVIVLIIQGSSQLTKNLQERTFIDKLQDSIFELAPSDFDDKFDIHKNWRAYESYRAILHLNSLNSLERVVGDGFGALVSLNFDKRMSGKTGYDEVISDIPWLHNAYLFLLIKTGALGFCLFLLFGFLQYKKSIKESLSKATLLSIIAQLRVFLILFLLFTTLIDGGLINRWDSSTIFLFLGLCSGLSRQNNEDINNTTFR